MFNPIDASRNIKDELEDYLFTTLHIADKVYAREFKEALRKEGNIAKGPYLDIGDSYETGRSLEELIQKGEASPLFRTLEGNIPDGEKELKIKRNLYRHQESALIKANAGKNLVVTTGTGSGKTECFIIPIINHLLKEKEQGTLGSGIRAIIIYPMNALANDQMKRLRVMLRNFPEITFGVYNSSTQETYTGGLNEYRKIFKDENGNSLNPIKNEVISRQDMRNSPPNILVTNYAMLEYMLLRPNDDQVFQGAKLKFLVLDEAHIYKGATGMETSLLLRRLKARISDTQNVIHILTSATLGGKDVNPEIVKFASTLCETGFNEQDIIRSEPKPVMYDGEEQDIPIEMFREIYKGEQGISNIFNKYNVEMKGKNEGEILYNLCAGSRIYNSLRHIVVRPMTILEIVNQMKNITQIDQEDVVALIGVASKAEKDKTALIKARYHMFARALEGAYITLDPYKTLGLKRNTFKMINGKKRRVFECAVCDECGRLAIVGQVNNSHVDFVSDIHDNKAKVYMIVNQDENVEFDEDDNENNKGEKDIKENEYYICSVCGEIHHASLKDEFCCGHGEDSLIKVLDLPDSKHKNNEIGKIMNDKKSEERGEFKCPICKSGKIKLFYAGYDAATAVLGTALYEQLPEYEIKPEIKKVEEKDKKDEKSLFGHVAKNNKNKVKLIKKQRQFLAFSDSRGEAAFFASYMTNYYKEFLRRRAIWHIVSSNKEDINRHPWEVKTLVDELTNYFDRNGSFAEPGDSANTNLHSENRRQAWIAVLNEMVNARRNTSLVSMGIINFVFKGINDECVNAVVEEYKQNTDDMKALLNLLVLDIVYNGALEGDSSINIGSDQRQYIYYSLRGRRFKLCKEADIDKGKSWINGWIPRARTNGGYFKNSRVERVMRSLGINEEKAIELLKDFWKDVLIDSLDTKGDDEYYLSTDKFLIETGADNHPLYQCDKCGRTTMFNENGHCISIKCDGHLQEVSRDTIHKNNHFANLYSSDLMKPLHIKEHTAQLGRKEQQDYQEMFINKKINALSCSTTFEMGVDVGDLETVYLRNVPPSPANYVQRAGRAGRSLKSAAYALTYAKLSSHDLTYYDSPQKMISGKIGVPVFTIENNKITLRHVFAVALSKFFEKYPEVYNKNDADMFLNGTGYELLKEYLKTKPRDLKIILKKSIPENMHSSMMIDSFGWIDEMIGDKGILEIAVRYFRDTVNWYIKEIKKFRRNGDDQNANKYENRLWEYRKGKEDNRGKNEFIEFLVRNNVLPKYGFPVDTVELYQNSNSTKEKRLQMVRDLQLAVAEYAPGSHVVADGKMYTSRYLRKLPQATGQVWETSYIAVCKNEACKTCNYSKEKPDKEKSTCIACGSPISSKDWMRAIEPRKGFIADVKVDDVPMTKPERDYRGDDYYIGDIQRKIINKKTFIVNGKDKIKIESSANDSLMVVCNDEFYVCGMCGWTQNYSEVIHNKNCVEEKGIKKIKHKTPWGSECEGSLRRVKLNHVFKTDVVKILFGTITSMDCNTMLSVMYALLEGASKELEIERNDIKGCLYRVRYDGELVYSITLYDAVAGGAGQVRRIVTDDGKVLERVIKRSIEITKGCTCDPSCYNCLRNYYNSKIHDLLDRKLAYTFLEKYVGTYKNIKEEDFEACNVRNE